MEELKPCPHCGAPAHSYEIEAHQHSPALLALCPDLPPESKASHVIEGKCGCGCGMIGDSLDEVAARWNRRAQPAQAEAVPQGKRGLPVESCKRCPHSVGRQSCSLANKRFDDVRPDVPPDWCPLPFIAAAPPQPT